MPNPAISRLSASPTPGNATRYSNVAQCVRETCTIAAIDDWPPRRSAASLKRTLVASAVSKLSFVRREIDVDVVAIGVAQMELYKPDRVQHEPLMWNGLFA